MCLPEDIEFKAKTQRRRDAAQTEEGPRRSEEHTSELQSQSNLVCRLLLEKKKEYLELSVAAASHHLQDAGGDYGRTPPAPQMQTQVLRRASPCRATSKLIVRADTQAVLAT